MEHTYVVMSGVLPLAARTTLGAAQDTAIAHDSRYLSEPREYRWDERVDTWELMFRSQRTGRWNKAYVVVHKVPTA